MVYFVFWASACGVRAWFFGGVFGAGSGGGWWGGGFDATFACFLTAAAGV